MQQAVIMEFEDLHRHWTMEGETVHALNGVRMLINAGERVAILGPSGSGKSTLLNQMGLLDRPTSGRYLLDGQDTSNLGSSARAAMRNQRIGFIFQNFHLLSNLSALDNVSLPMHYAALPAAKIKEMAMHALQKVGLGARAAHRPNQLSGGERQRVAIARAIALAPKILLADEPTGSLDSENGHHILELIENLHRQYNMTVVMITHDSSIANRFPRCIRMCDGRIVEDTIMPAFAGSDRPIGSPLRYSIKHA